MKKPFLIVGGLAVLLAITCVVSFNMAASEFKSEYNKATEVIGQSVVLNGDTLMIIDYSLMDKYTLSNGQEVGAELVKKLPKVQQSIKNKNP